MKIICLGNYPPRKCGIATFTENLIKSIFRGASNHNLAMEIEVIAMNDNHQSYDYPEIVRMTLNEQDIEDYVAAAEYINHSNADLFLLQHEYGIYGGNSGLMVLSLLQRLRVPIVATFHTVLLNPTFHQKEVLKKIAQFADRVVIMNGMAIDFLTDVFDVDRSKIVKIEHGVPDFSTIDNSLVQIPKNWEGRKTLLTFGLIGRSKGIETVIKALPDVVKEHPEILYVVLGKTHPHVAKYAGEEYREYLQSITLDLGLGSHVEFLDTYVSEVELTNYLLAADIYVTPYLNKAQITSGTLCYALGGGLAVVSTPYWHAEELLSDNRGRLFDFRDYHQLANILNDLLDHPDEMKQLSERAYAYGLTISWPKIGFEYIQTFQKAISGFNTNKARLKLHQIKFPALNISHLQRLTDSTGIIQHAQGSVPSFKSGYCLDDNARALIVCLMAYNQTKDKLYIPYIYRYTSYLSYVQNDDGSFKNYLTYARLLTEKTGSDDAYGRAIWALGALIRFSPNDSLFQIGMDLFFKAIEKINIMVHARGYANCIFGLYHYVKKFPDQEKYVKLLIGLADKLLQKFYHHNEKGWPWFESSITYDNGLLPASLYIAYELTEKPEYISVADQSRMFLESKCIVNGQITLIGNKNWWIAHHDKSSRYAQQPIDAMALVWMYDSAYRADQNPDHLKKLKMCFNWFLGMNDLNLPLYDDQTHGCNDGLEETNVNRNQGAESTLAYLLSWLLVNSCERNK
jgi:glycosyltransferase involved in cell wall biosynthesis